MAIMLPPAIPPGAPASERRVFDMLHDDPATDGWVVIHSSLYQPASGRPREIDFLALIPNYGMLCVEVKGGGFRVERGQWYSLSSDEPMQAPVDQARQAMFALQNALERKFGPQSDAAGIPLDCAVVFTDTDWPEHIQRPPHLVVDNADLHSGLSLGRRLQALAMRMRPAAEWRTKRASPFTAPEVDEMRQYLAPDFTMELVIAVGPQLDVIEEQLVRLTEEQYAALDLARDNDRCLFKGAAGTGKTMLAVECARRAAASGQRVALLCYNRLLGHWLSQQTPPAGRIAAGAFWPDLLRPVIVSSPAGPDFENAENDVISEQELYEQVYPEYARRALGYSGPLFDTLIMDEAQDLCQSPYLDIIDLMLEGGLSGGRWAMFGDFTNQAIYLSDAADPEGNLLRYCAHPARRSLLVNCRNTPPIARDTARIIRTSAPATRLAPVAGPMPEYHYWDDAAHLSDLLDEEIHRLIAEDVRVGEIVVLSTRRLDNSGLDQSRTYGSYPLLDHSRGQRLPDAGDESDADDAAAHLKFCTVQSFKGMESHVVVLILERLDRENDLPYAYVGMSRAKGALRVLAQAGLRPELEALLDH